MIPTTSESSVKTATSNGDDNRRWLFSGNRYTLDEMIDQVRRNDMDSSHTHNTGGDADDDARFFLSSNHIPVESDDADAYGFVMTVWEPNVWKNMEMTLEEVGEAMRDLIQALIATGQEEDVEFARAGSFRSEAWTLPPTAKKPYRDIDLVRAGRL